MQIKVLLFGVLKDLAGRSSDVLSLPEHATAADVVNHYAERLSKTNGIFSSIAISINQEYARPEDQLRPGDEVALLPPVSGGSDDTPLVRLVHERIVPNDIVPAMERPEDGAVVIFDGIVRNHSRGRRTIYLVYEAYEPMALRKLQELASGAKSRYSIRNVAIVHRLGRIEIGESSVLIAVLSAHRAAAFDACRWIIDTLKRTVPIWKKEYFEDGAIWSDGEPFPAQVLGARASSLVQNQDEAQKTGTHPEKPASNRIAHK